jgi:hypothetical protein
VKQAKNLFYAWNSRTYFLYASVETPRLSVDRLAVVSEIVNEVLNV